MTLKDLSHIGLLSTGQTDFPELRKLGEYKVYRSVPDEDAKRSFNVSMHNAMKLNRGQKLLLVEEDVYFSDLTHLDQALAELPENFELCYLGANLVDEVQGYSEHLVKTMGCWTTHAVIYNCCAEIADIYDGETMFDEWLRANIHARGNTYVIRPFVAYQQTHYSALWQQDADYGEILNTSNQKAIDAH